MNKSKKKNARQTMNEWRKTTEDRPTCSNAKILTYPTSLDRFIQKQDDCTMKINETINNCFCVSTTDYNNDKASYDALVAIQNTKKQMKVNKDLWKINKNTQQHDMKKQGNKELLEIFMHNNDIDISILSETWLNSHKETGLKSYNWIRQSGILH
ncbi:uncharacterized protein LOC110118920 [Ceratitis capitata]|uniref:uncharacterized protein LOC110118920 n=1 Tax=Ceratitis capitata TaxID=7213 RepID=UPI000A10A4FD|nr:uncharacterized protein LOC110118920 [Ceratitis capitata]